MFIEVYKAYIDYANFRNQTNELIMRMDVYVIQKWLLRQKPCKELCLSMNSNFSCTLT